MVRFGFMLSPLGTLRPPPPQRICPRRDGAWTIYAIDRAFRRTAPCGCANKRTRNSIGSPRPGMPVAVCGPDASSSRRSQPRGRDRWFEAQPEQVAIANSVPSNGINDLGDRHWMKAKPPMKRRPAQPSVRFRWDQGISSRVPPVERQAARSIQIEPPPEAASDNSLVERKPRQFGSWIAGLACRSVFRNGSKDYT